MKLCKCGRVVVDRCDACYPTTHSQTTKQRGYDYKWKRLSERVRIEQPLCPDCEAEGRAVAATEVHHIVPIVACEALRLERSNLVALCSRHHAEREGRDVNTK